MVRSGGGSEEVRNVEFIRGLYNAPIITRSSTIA